MDKTCELAKKSRMHLHPGSDLYCLTQPPARPVLFPYLDASDKIPNFADGRFGVHQ